MMKDESHEAAASAVIATMYGVKDALSRLQQPELVYAVKYADLLQIDFTTAKVLELLVTSADTEQGLASDTLAALAVLPIWPSCMLALLPKVAQAAVLAASGQATSAAASTDSRNASIQAVLVAVLGHLEHVWQQQDLPDILLKLPLPAMSLLLSSDKLTVYSEDTVLYTACKFVAAQRTLQQQTTAAGCLSALIRVPHLSEFQLTLQCMTAEGVVPSDVLRTYTSSVQTFLTTKRLGLSAADMLAQVKEHIPSAPSSWSCGRRQLVAVPCGGVTLTWDVPVSELKGRVLKCEQTKRSQAIRSHTSPELAGGSGQYGPDAAIMQQAMVCQLGCT